MKYFLLLVVFFNLSCKTENNKSIALEIHDFSGIEPYLKLEGDKTYVVNFWATWCPPCVEEMPMLSEFQSQHAQRIQVLGLAVDQVSAVKKFLDKTPVSYPVAMAGSLGLSIAKDLGNQGGGLPFSVFFDDKGAQMDSKVGKLDQSMLDAWLKELRG